jgi:DNA-binding Lrp family transcriptional regulator
LENTYFKPDPILISAIPTTIEENRNLRKAFVFITTDPELCDCAMDDLRKIEGVMEVYLSRGTYDIVAKVAGESIEHLRELVFSKIKNLPSIKSTLTLTVV